VSPEQEQEYAGIPPRRERQLVLFDVSAYIGELVVERSIYEELGDPRSIYSEDDW
jgi:hypothetical protein